MHNTHYSCQILMKLEFSLTDGLIYSNIKFHKNPSSGNLVVPCRQTEGQTDRRDEAISLFFRNFAQTHSKH